MDYGIRYGGPGRYGGTSSEIGYLSQNDVAAPLTAEDREYLALREQAMVRETHVPDVLLGHEQPITLDARREQSHAMMNLWETGRTSTALKPYLEDGADLTFLEAWRDERPAGSAAALSDARADNEQRLKRLPMKPETPIDATALTTLGATSNAERVHRQKAMFYDGQARHKFDNDALMSYVSGSGITATSTRGRADLVQELTEHPDGAAAAKLDILRGDRKNWGRDFSDVPQGYRYTVADHVFKVGAIDHVRGRKAGYSQDKFLERRRVMMTDGVVDSTKRDKSSGNRVDRARIAMAMTDVTKARGVAKTSEKWGAAATGDTSRYNARAVAAQKDTVDKYLAAVHEAVTENEMKNTTKGVDLARQAARGQASTDLSGKTDHDASINTVQLADAINDAVRGNRARMTSEQISAMGQLSKSTVKLGAAKQVENGRRGRADRVSAVDAAAARNSRTLGSVQKGRSFSVVNRRGAKPLESTGRVAADGVRRTIDDGAAKNVEFSRRANATGYRAADYGNQTEYAAMSSYDALATGGSRRGGAAVSRPSGGSFAVSVEESNWQAPGSS